MKLTRYRGRNGSSIIETVVGCLFLVPVALFLFDVGVLVLAQTENDRLAKSCARAAADCADIGSGIDAANKMFIAEQDRLGTSSYIKPLTCTVSDNGTSWATATATTVVNCKLPVPIPFVTLAPPTFTAKSTEPVVGVLSATTP